MDAPPILVRFHRRYGTASEAEQLRRALETDRPEYLDTVQEGPILRFELRATSAASARATLDDLLAAVTAAERTRDLRTAEIGPPKPRRAARPARRAYHRSP